MEIRGLDGHEMETADIHLFQCICGSRYMGNRKFGTGNGSHFQAVSSG
jgi:hypothetical protein